MKFKPFLTLTLTDGLVSISSWFRIHIHGFDSDLQFRIRNVEYETGKFKSDSLVFKRKLITLKVKISILRVFSQTWWKKIF